MTKTSIYRKRKRGIYVLEVALTSFKSETREDEPKKVRVARSSYIRCDSSDVGEKHYFQHYQEENNGKHVESSIQHEWEAPLASNKAFLIHRLCNLKMREDTFVINYINEFNKLRLNFNDKVKAIILLSSQSKSLFATKIVVASLLDNNKLKLNDVWDLILNEDIHKRQFEKCSLSGSTMSIENRGRSHSKRQNHKRSKSKGKSKNHKDIICWIYQRKWHFSSKCKTPKKRISNKMRSLRTRKLKMTLKH